MAETLEALRKRLADEEKALRARFAEKLAAARKREARAAAAAAKKRRAVENHGKYILAGFVLSQAKAAGSMAVLAECLKATKTDRDRAAVQALIDSVSSTGGSAPSAQVSPSSKPQPKKEGPQTTK